ncbi:MAG: AAA family ATPase [Synergistes sp.]|nr:AAA family ATPase [Synergistes sp.]
MGKYFNPSNQSFTDDSTAPIYVDKTGLLEHLNRCIRTPNRCVAVSHARRFGKSQAAGMLDAYYSKGCNSHELFSRFEIAKTADFEKYLNKYNVIHIDMAQMCDNCNGDFMEKLFKTLTAEFAASELGDKLDCSKPVELVISDIYTLTDLPFVIIIDEWDCVVRNYASDQRLVHEYMQFLHALFKSELAKQFLALGYITGILPIKKFDDESTLNNFREYTMINSRGLTKYFGFTENEVEELCIKYNADIVGVKEWYDGYDINGISMYNPNSVCQAMEFHELTSYWTNTSSFSTINRFVTLNFEGLKDDVINMLKGERVAVNVRTFRNDLSEINSKDDALTALIHLGYLAYDTEMEEAYIPNFEVALAYHSALPSSGWKDVADSISRCTDLLNATIRKDEEKVAELIDKAHTAYTSHIKYNDENSLSCVVSMAYFTAPAYYTIVREFASGRGFADLAFIPKKMSSNRPPMIIELKWNKSADSAIKQVKEKRYHGALSGFCNEILLVGINYDKDDKDKKHTCKIERVRNV